MNFATTLLLCLVCSVFAFKVTKDRRSLTDVVSMGRKYRRHSKEVEASALELVVTESGNTALKLDAKGSKDYVAVHLSRKEARKFKAAFAASKGEPLSLSLHQYKIGGKKYYALFENHHDKYAPVDLEGVQEEKVKTICRTARSVAAALYFFSLLLYSVSFTVSVVLILAATGLINYVCVDAFNGHNDVTGYDALQKDDGTVVWGSAELIVYTCLGDAYNVRVACFNRA